MSKKGQKVKYKVIFFIQAKAKQSEFFKKKYIYGIIMT